jgi:hypothetical protein
MSTDKLIHDAIPPKTLGMEDLKTEFDFRIKELKNVESENKNVFPTEVFPSNIQQIIKATNSDLNFPIDFICASILYVASIAIGNSHRVKVKNGWTESAVLYISIVGPPGTNKTHPLTFALQPIMEEDKRAYAAYENQRQEYLKAMSLSKKEREQENIDEPQKPTLEKFLLKDFTPEALAEVHKINKRGIGVNVDEIAGWFKNFNRYNKGSEVEFWLSGWSGTPINIDRKTGEPIFIPLPFISVGGTIQNGILGELAKDNRTQNGFIDRILFAIPDEIKKEYWTETELSDSVIHDWEEIVSKLLGLSVQYDESSNPLPEIMQFSNDAKSILYNWQRDNADQSNSIENESIKGIYSKLEIYAIRLSLILEVLHWACNESEKESIGVRSTEGALKLVEYFRKSAIKVNAIISSDNPLDKLPSDKQCIYIELPDSFTTEQGLQIAERLEMPERTFKRFLNEKELFKKVKRGYYEKLI